MSYRTLIESTLSSIGAPVAFQTYTGDLFPYVTFFCYNEQGELFAEGDEVVTGYYIQVDVWSKTRDYDSLVNQIKSDLKAIDFNREFEQDFYETDTKIFHKAIRFNYLVEN